MPHCDFRNAVAVVVVDVEIDSARHVPDEYVARPCWILEPREFGAALVHDDEVRPAVAVQVGNYELIAHLQGVRNRGLPPLRQFCARQGRNQHKEKNKQHQTNSIRNDVPEELVYLTGECGRDDKTDEQGRRGRL